MRGKGNVNAFKRPSRARLLAISSYRPCPLCGLEGPPGGHPQCVARDQSRVISLSDRHRPPVPIHRPEGPARTQGPSAEQEPRTNRSAP